MPKWPPQKDDDPLFDPRIRWASENSEDVAYLLQQRQNNERQKKILYYLKKGPIFMGDLAKETGLEVSAISWAIRVMMKQKKIPIQKKKVKDRMLFTLGDFSL